MPLQIFYNLDHVITLLAEKFFNSRSLPGTKLQRHKSGGRQKTPGIHDQASDYFESILTRLQRAHRLKVSDLLGQLRHFPIGDIRWIRHNHIHAQAVVQIL